MDSNAIKTSIQIPSSVGSQTAVSNTGKRGIWVFQLLLIISDYLQKSKKIVRFDRKNCQTALFLLYYLLIVLRIGFGYEFNLKVTVQSLGNKKHFVK